jgi:site-specific recombinase XerD
VKNHSDHEKKKYSTKVTTPKRESSVRKVPLDNTAVETLDYLHRKNKHEKDNLVFPNRNGNMLSRRNVAHTLERMLTRVSFSKRPSLHDLRHTYASELIRNGINVKKVSQILGHSDVSTTLNIYVHVGEDEYDDVRDALD